MSLCGQVPVTEARQKILKQEQPVIPMVEAKQTILKQELQAELKGALEGRRAPSLPIPDDSLQAAGGAPDDDRETNGNEADAQVGKHCSFLKGACTALLYMSPRWHRWQSRHHQPT